MSDVVKIRGVIVPNDCRDNQIFQTIIVSREDIKKAQEELDTPKFKPGDICAYSGTVGVVPDAAVASCLATNCPTIHTEGKIWLVAVDGAYIVNPKKLTKISDLAQVSKHYKA